MFNLQSFFHRLRTTHTTIFEYQKQRKAPIADAFLCFVPVLYLSQFHVYCFFSCVMLLVLILRLYLLGHTVVLIQILLPVLFLLLLFIHTITPELVCQNRCFLCTERRFVQSYYSIFKVPPLILKFELHIAITFFIMYCVNSGIRYAEF